MNFKEIFEKNSQNIPTFSNKKFKEIRDQSSRHSTRRGDLSILDTLRPGQTKDQNEYLKKVYRNVTKQLYDKIITESKTIFNNSGFNWNYPDKLSEYYSKNKIKVGKLEYDFIKYVSLHLLSKAYCDPNAIIVPIPYSTNDEIQNPSLLPQNTDIPFKEVLISSASYQEMYGALVFKHSKKKTEDGKHEMDVFMAIDKEWYYLLIPDRDRKYSVETWYNHNLGRIPCTEMIGNYVEEESDGDILFNRTGTIVYKESFIQGVFELLDKALYSSSDSDASQIHHAYPKLVVTEVSCKPCNGTGKIKGNACNDCNGSGVITNFSPLSAIQIPKDSVINGNNRAIAEYISAPTDALRHLFEVWQNYLNLAANSVGVDPYINAQESGEAMKMRMQTLEKFLLNLGNAVADMLESHWKNMSDLLFPLAEKEIIVISRPKKILLRNETTIIQDINSATGAERIEYVKEFNRYRLNDEAELRATTLYYKLYPFAALDMGEKQFGLTNGVFDRDSLRESYYALPILKELCKSNPDNTDEKIISNLRAELSKIIVKPNLLELVTQ